MKCPVLEWGNDAFKIYLLGFMHTKRHLIMASYWLSQPVGQFHGIVMGYSFTFHTI